MENVTRRDAFKALAAGAAIVAGSSISNAQDGRRRQSRNRQNQGGGASYNKNFQARTVPAEPPPNRTSDATNAPYGYVTPDGSFDLSEDGIFQYLLGEMFYPEPVQGYHEDSDWYYFQETNFPDWLWAFRKNPDPNTAELTVFGTFGQEEWEFFANAVRGESAG